MNILKVSEKNCYPLNNHLCQHVCIIQDKNVIKSKLLNSSQIYDILLDDSPMHIKEKKLIKNNTSQEI